MVALLGGCTGRPSQPSTPAERAINPETITRDNPAGDALSPTDAALERLLNQKLGRKIDKFKTIEPAFADAKNWKRIRFFGYPTRGGFRYGKDPSYAAAVLYYWEAEDDAPTSCIEHFATKAQRIADVFDLDVGEMKRQMRDHRRGVEAVDWPAWEDEWLEREEKRIAALKERIEKSEKRREAMRKRVARRRAARMLRFRLAAAKPKLEAAPAEGESGAKAGTTKIDTQKKAEPKASDASVEPDTKPPPAPQPAEEALSAEEAEALAKRKKRLEALKKRVEAAKRRRAERLANMTPEEKKKLEERRQQAKERRQQARERRKERLAKMMQPRPAPIPKAKELGVGDMPAITTSGEFTTLFNRDKYLGAMVAYDSWPGTCLVQGFAVKVGSDEALAQKVLDRWLDEMAPILRWHRDLREQPPIKNR
jgi:hypothetical protein